MFCDRGVTNKRFSLSDTSPDPFSLRVYSKANKQTLQHTEEDRKKNLYFVLLLIQFFSFSSSAEKEGEEIGFPIFFSMIREKGEGGEGGGGRGQRPSYLSSRR